MMMKDLYKIAIVVCVLFAAGSVRAQEPASGPWSLRQCIDYAVANNIGVKQQELAVKDAEINLNSAQNSRLPGLSASAGQSYGQSVSPITGGYEATRSASTSLGISTSVPIYNGRRISRQIEYSQLNLNAAIENLSKARENLGLQVAAFYLDALFKKELLKVAEKQIELNQKQVEQTRILVDAGKVPISQLYDIQAQLAKNEVNLVNARNNLEVSLLDLAQMLNLPRTADFDIRIPTEGSLATRQQAGIFSPDDIYLMAIGIKPHVREAEYRLQGSEKNLRIAKSALEPSLNLSASYNTGYSYVFNVPGQSSFFDQLNDNRRMSTGLNLSIPIFNRFQTRNQVQSAQLEIESRKLELQNVKQALYKEIQQAYQSAMAAQAKFVASEAAHQAALLAYEHMEKRYAVGKATVFELSQAQNQMLVSQSEQLQAQYDFVFRSKILDFYRGEPIDIL